MYTLCSEINIGGKSFGGVYEVKVAASIHTPGATAVLKVPVTAVLRQKNQISTVRETAQMIKVGEPVVIRLGYDGKMNEEFRGYVRKLNYRTPLEIECEDAFFLTRQRGVVLSGSMLLRECLEKCGLPVGYAVDLKLRNFVVNDKPVSWVLGKLKTDYGLNVFFDGDGRVVAGRAFDRVGKEVKYRLRYNVIGDDDLKYLSAENVRLKVKAVCFRKDGEKKTAEAGVENGVTKTLHFYDVEDSTDLHTLAEQELKRYSRDGYEGKIETFLFPYASPGMLAVVEDPAYPERDGRYYIEGVETTYGRNGARRRVSMGIKM